MKNTNKTKDIIIASAALLFERQSYAKTSMDEIAKQAHKAKTSIYYHFASKQDILHDVLEREFKIITDELNSAMQTHNEDPQKQLSEYLTLRMKLLCNARVYRHYISMPITEITEETETIADVRKSFDNMEYSFFYKICISGFKAGILPDGVNEDAFARMMITILKGLEIQFIRSENHEQLQETYETMLRFIILK